MNPHSWLAHPVSGNDIQLLTVDPRNATFSRLARHLHVLGNHGMGWLLSLQRFGLEYLVRWTLPDLGFFPLECERLNPLVDTWCMMRQLNWGFDNNVYFIVRWNCLLMGPIPCWFTVTDQYYIARWLVTRWRGATTREPPLFLMEIWDNCHPKDPSIRLFLRRTGTSCSINRKGYTWCLSRLCTASVVLKCKRE